MASQGHVIHKCPNKSSEDFRRMHGWSLEELPLNADRHDYCPYCGAETKGMEHAPAEEVGKLQVNLRGRARGAGARDNAQISGLEHEIRELRKLVTEMKGGKA